MKKIYTRMAACFLAALLTFNIFAVPQAKASTTVTMLAPAVLAAYAQSVGVSLTASSAGAVSSGMTAAIGGYAAATGTTSAAVTSGIAAGAVISTSGTIILTVAACALLAGIVAWAVDEYGLKDADEPIYLGPVIDGYTSYNGKELPDMEPIWEQVGKNAYPYVLFSTGTNPDGNIGTMYFVQKELVHKAGGLYSVDGGSLWYYHAYYTGGTSWDGPNGPYMDNAGACFALDNYHSWAWSNFDILTADGAVFLAASAPVAATDPSNSVGVELAEGYEAPPEVSEQHVMVIDTGVNAVDEQGIVDAILAGIADSSFAPTYTIEVDTSGDSGSDGGTDTGSTEDEKQTGFLGRIADGIDGLAEAIKDGIGSLFTPDPALMAEITDTFSAKFDFISDLHGLGTDLLNLDPEQTPPVIYIHLEEAESNYGFAYGGTTKALDMAWYEPYKEDVDRIISGFLWLGFLWLCFMRASDIINGAGMAYAAGQPTIYTPESPHDAPRLGAPRWRRRG